VAVTDASICTGAQLLPKDKISFFREQNGFNRGDLRQSILWNVKLDVRIWGA